MTNCLMQRKYAFTVLWYWIVSVQLDIQEKLVIQI